MTPLAPPESAMVLLDPQPASCDIRYTALKGLTAVQKTLPCSLFYDDVGAALFQAICRTPEYYPTRTEIAILRARASGIAAAIGANARLVELGTGEGMKTRILLRELHPLHYCAVDISRNQLLQTTQALAYEFPDVCVQPICADYTRHWSLPSTPASIMRTAFFFPGSTIGNFEPADAEMFLRSLAHLAGHLGGLLIGVDLHKNSDRLNAAYNDADGITAAFNLNILRVLNREAGADFDLEYFGHEARYDELHRRIEMRLISKRRQQVRLSSRYGDMDWVVDFAAGESIVTEHSYKYSLTDFGALVNRAGWTLADTWLDPERLFAVHWCVLRQ